MCEGMIHHSVIRDSIISCEPAFIKGSIYRLNVGYPVFMTEGDTNVKGYVVSLKPSELLPSILDEFHGVNAKQPNRSIYDRVSTQAMVNSELVDVEVYSLRAKKLPKDAFKIECGDWEKDLKEQTPLQDRFDEEEIAYISKIGKTTGREVIPYTPMTRQLEKKGLVIDKGRRPALTTYGKEVFKYLGL